MLMSYNKALENPHVHRILVLAEPYLVPCFGEMLAGQRTQIFVITQLNCILYLVNILNFYWSTYKYIQLGLCITVILNQGYLAGDHVLVKCWTGRQPIYCDYPNDYPKYFGCLFFKKANTKSYIKLRILSR